MNTGLYFYSVLTRKARERSSNYEEVKEAILKIYEMVTEAYRQKCRNCRKRDDQTHVDFAREKELCLTSGSLLTK
jgi:hypothetical protein